MLKDTQMRVRRLVARAHGLPVVDRAATLVRFLQVGYENVDWDMRTNGETRVIQAGTAKARPIVFDVGANKGDWTAAVLAANENAQVHAFEIVPVISEQLHDRFLGDPRVTINAIGLLDDSATCSVEYFPDKSTTSGVVRGEGSQDPAAVLLSADVISGDAYAEQHGVDHIDVLKIDTEGADLDVLRGFRHLIERRGVRLIQFEYGAPSLDARVLLRDFYDLLAPHGYEIGKVYPRLVEFRRYERRHEDFLGFNYVAVRDDETTLVDQLGRRSHRSR